MSMFFFRLYKIVILGVKKVLLKISQNSQRTTCVRVSFLIKLQIWFYYKKRLWNRCFPVNFVKFLKTTFFYRTPLDDCFRIDKIEKLKYWNWKIEILQSNSSGLVVSLKTQIFGLREPQKEIFEFYLRIRLTFKWSYYHIGIYFCEINYVFWLPKDCFSP